MTNLVLCDVWRLCLIKWGESPHRQDSEPDAMKWKKFSALFIQPHKATVQQVHVLFMHTWEQVHIIHTLYMYIHCTVIHTVVYTACRRDIVNKHK